MLSDITSTIEFQMSFLLFVSLTGYQLAVRINQSAVIGEILVGIAVGPGLLGLITYTDFVSALAHLGAVILLFVVGLEFKLRDIYNVKYGVIALVGVVVPWLGGYLTAGLFGYDFRTSVLVGTALSATSVAITAEVLREMNMLHSATAKAIIGAAVLDDVLSLLALSMSEQLISGELSLFHLLFMGVKAIGFLILGTIIGYKVLTHHMIKLDRSDIARKYPEFVFIYAMMVAFFYSMMGELLGLSAIVGAFVAGTSLEGIRQLEHSRDYREGAEYLHIIFASIFFVSLGILADIQAVNKGTILFLAVLVVVAILTKLFGCALPAFAQGMNARDSLTIGFGMVPRGEVAMIVALIGLSQGILNQEMYVSLVLMSLITTIIPPVVLRHWLLKK
jgi:Kef-type K+ transport system membrane component KefB